MLSYKLFFKFDRFKAHRSNKPALLHANPYTVSELHYQFLHAFEFVVLRTSIRTHNERNATVVITHSLTRLHRQI